MTALRALALIWALGLTSAATAGSMNRVVIEGAVKRGDEFSRDIGSGFTFRLQGKDGWSIVITHATSPDKDLVYPMNPPYRFSNRQRIGPGYGDSARESISYTPRDLGFIYRPADIGRAWADLDRVLWPYSFTEAEVQKAIDDLTQIPTGTVTFDVLTAELGHDESRPGAEEQVLRLTFRVIIAWPGASSE